MTATSRVCIIGAGLAGLTAAYDLGRWGHQVIVLESGAELGGLAGSLLLSEKRPIERFYHFICKGDDDLLGLVDELGLSESLHWVQAPTSFFYHGRHYAFGLPTDLMRFTPAPFLQRLRFGLNVIQSRYRRSWQKLDEIPAASWLRAQIGEEAYRVIWEPLLKMKFGDLYDKVSAAWIWHRIHRVAQSRRHLWEHEYLGYLERGSETVVAELARRIRQMPNVQIRTQARVENIDIESGNVCGIRLQGKALSIPCEQVVSTVALAPFLRMCPSLPSEYRQRLNSIEYLGVVCGLFKLRQRFSNSFWVNVNDPAISFNGFIEYSNLNRHLGLGEQAIVYIPYYLRTSAPRYDYSDDQLRAEMVAGLQRINPAFDNSWIKECHISRAAHAQAICGINFSRLVPGHQTPISGLYITDSTQYYPEDRTISAAIRLGRCVARLIKTQPKKATPLALYPERMSAFEEHLVRPDHSTDIARTKPGEADDERAHRDQPSGGPGHGNRVNEGVGQKIPDRFGCKSSGSVQVLLDRSRLYQARFGPEDRQRKDRLWATLCRHFFQRYIRPTDTVMDVGAGSCEFLRNIRCGARIAIDTDPAIAAHAPPDARILQTASTDLSAVATDSVDIAFVSNFFEHLPDTSSLLQTLREIRRVLQPGGRLLVLQPNIRVLGGQYWDFLDHHLPLTDRSLVEALGLIDMHVQEVRPRFLPFTTKSALPQHPLLVRFYLRLPLLHTWLGGQAWIVAAKPAQG